MSNLPRLRIDNCTVAIPIVYGSCSIWLGQKKASTTSTADQSATHKWTIFLRGPNDEDLSPIVKKVAFSLHVSFADPVREVFVPPFELTEYGWGEFDVGLRIFWQDPDEQPIDLHHFLRLYHSDGAAVNIKKPVMSDKYDEVVFTNPTNSFKRLLMMYQAPSNPIPSHLSEYLTHFNETEDMQKLIQIQDHLTSEIENAKRRLFQLDAEVTQITSTVPVMQPN